jgi:hypothetical protein
MKIYYRISDKSYDKPKLPGATKEVCLMNFCQAFANVIFPQEERTEVPPIKIIADNCERKTTKMIQESGLPWADTYEGNAGSLKLALEIALEECEDDELVYMVEDDYLHLPIAPKLLEEGIKRAEYVTLYDHPDKYTRYYDGGETSKVIKTASSHWRYTASTCMTFGTKIKTLREDFPVWKEFIGGERPEDHKIFTKLWEDYRRRLTVCIPGVACHVDLAFSGIVKHVLMEPWAIEMMIQKLEEGLDDDSLKIIGNKEGWDRLITLEALHSASKGLTSAIG